MTGIELIAKEREEQILKHGRTVHLDVVYNGSGQLRQAAKALLYLGNAKDVTAHQPMTWLPEVWRKMYLKGYRERLIIAGALIAAELDRINESAQ